MTGLTALLALAAVAYPNFTGLTGIVGVPNALTTPSRSFTAAADVVFMNDTTLNARALYGATDRLEVGAALIAGEDTAFGIGAKFRLPVATTAGSLALGLSFVESNDGGSGSQAFIVGSRTIAGMGAGNSLLGSLGLSFTDLEGVDGVRPFIGAQLVLPANFEIAGEFALEAGDFNESIFSLVVRRRLAAGWTGELGFTNAAGFIGTSDHDFFLGAAYTFGAAQ